MPQDYHIARERMVNEQLVSNGIVDPRVIDAMRDVPRHLFVDAELGPQAYSDHAFPIGYSQTMSQPFMVAFLAEQLALTGREQVLEIGTGSGYQAAVLARLAGHVYSIERIEALATRAADVLGSLEIQNIQVLIGDGSTGWPEFQPYDRILTTAAAAEVPQSLLMQLRDGGAFLGPVYNKAGEQEIVRLTRNGQEFGLERLRKCSFVPLVREESEKAAKDPRTQ
ncbi:MAG: protein-L-isoaspartate(D-aspartate) O-methyltransferase [Candidatus Latescibacterota bacterium]|nr:MAG: protein-L-isoaspartate(D-aspartate) O-methyltransferase [Candidatus Latescibacterota bacterium]